ncbi:MAG: glycosyltransferase family 4 protein [Anaerolineae bacterium]
MRIWMPTRITLAHGVRGGMERQTDTLARALAARGHSVTIVTTAHPKGVLRETEPGIETLYLPNSTWRRYQAKWWAASYAALRERDAAQPYDVILSHSAGGLGYLADARRDLGLPSVVILHGSSQGEVTTAWRGARSPRGAYRLARLGWRLPRLLYLWRAAAPSVARWIAVSPSVATENRREIGFPADGVTFVPNGVDVARFRPDAAARQATRERLGVAPHAPLLAIATRLEAEKGVQVAIDALSRAQEHTPAVRMVIAGHGSHFEALDRQVRRLGLSQRVTFLGLVAHEELPGILAAADIFIMPSLCHEAFPLSIVEAMAAGLPVVASRVGGVGAAVTDGVTGALVGPGDDRALGAAIVRLASDPTRRQAMGAIARRTAEARFSVAAMTAATEAVLQGAIAETPRPLAAGSDRP